MGPYTAFCDKAWNTSPHCGVQDQSGVEESQQSNKAGEKVIYVDDHTPSEDLGFMRIRVQSNPEKSMNQKFCTENPAATANRCWKQNTVF